MVSAGYSGLKESPSSGFIVACMEPLTHECSRSLGRLLGRAAVVSAIYERSERMGSSTKEARCVAWICDEIKVTTNTEWKKVRPPQWRPSCLCAIPLSVLTKFVSAWPRTKSVGQASASKPRRPRSCCQTTPHTPCYFLKIIQAWEKSCCPRMEMQGAVEIDLLPVVTCRVIQTETSI